MQGDEQVGSRVVGDIGALVQRNEYVRVAGHNHVLPQPDELVAHRQRKAQVVVLFQPPLIGGAVVVAAVPGVDCK